MKGLKHCFDEGRTIQDKKAKKPQKLGLMKNGEDMYEGEFKDGLMHGYG